MNDKDRVAGFKALLRSHQTNNYDLIETDGDFRLWRELTAEGKLETIARDAAFYDVTFEQFAEAAREFVGTAALEEAALRLAMRGSRELHDLEKLFPDEGGIGSPPPLVERIRELLDTDSRGLEEETWLTPEEQAELFKEVRADEAAAKREDTHWYGKMTLQELREEKVKSPDTEKSKDRDIEK